MGRPGTGLTVSGEGAWALQVLIPSKHGCFCSSDTVSPSEETFVGTVRLEAKATSDAVNPQSSDGVLCVGKNASIYSAEQLRGCRGCCGADGLTWAYLKPVRMMPPKHYNPSVSLTVSSPRTKPKPAPRNALHAPIDNRVGIRNSTQH
jgi:hypothetical protein